MGLFETLTKTAGRARYTAAQGLRAAWYGGQYRLARRRSAGFNRPGEPVFKPAHRPDPTALRKAYFDLFRQDRANVEAGLYVDPVAQEMRLQDLPKALRKARTFLQDVEAVDQRRVDRDGTEVRQSEAADPKRFPAYYRQNFHYQSDGWLSEDSAKIYDHQVEALFTGSADAMRRATLAELAREIRGRDQREVKALDLACGTGRFMQQVLTSYPRLGVSGLDLSPPYAEAARKTVANWPQAEIVEGQAEAIPFEDGVLDAVTCIYLFHELPPRVRPQVIAEAARVLKPGGAFIVADSLQFGDNEGVDGFLEYFPEGFHEPYYKGYLKWDFAPAMAAAGLKAETTQLAFLTKVKVWRKAVQAMLAIPVAMLSDLKHRYSEAHRHYHTWKHIEALLGHFETIKNKLHDPEAVLLALYWHDAIYDPKAADNEDQSAAILLEQANGLLEQDRLNFAAAIIRATHKHLVPKGLSKAERYDLECFLDIDLSILAAPRTVFDLYEANIRKEYSFVPAEAYRQGRRAVLSGFLNRERLYFSAWFYELWEQPARANLRRSIARLSKMEI